MSVAAPDQDASGFWHAASLYPEKAAVVTVLGDVVTYGELARRVNRLSHLLLELGLVAGDHAAFLLGNQVETYEMALGCTQIGVLFTPINHHFVTKEVAYILEDSEAKALVADARFAAVASEAAELAALPMATRLSVGEIDGFRDLRQASENCSGDIPPDRVAGGAFFYTSGTTGVPKGVFRPSEGPRSLGDVIAFSVKSAIDGELTPEGVHLVQGPLHHSGPLGGSLNALHIGATVVVMDKWNAEVCLTLVDQYGVTTTQMVPTMFQRLLALPAETKAQYDVTSLRMVKHGSAACPVPTKRGMIDWWGPVLLEIYGGQEGRITSITSQEWLTHPGSVGRADRLTTVKILDQDGNECPQGEVGTIYGKITGVEYFKAPEKTAASRRGDFFTLGDMGYIDPDGWLFLVDRRTDLIVSGGVNIYPAEVEAVLLQHPAVVDAAVIGVPNDEWGHEVKAVVETAANVEPGPALEEEIIDFTKSRLARYKCPRSVDFRVELPRDALGKLRKRDLRDEYLVKNTEEAASR